MKWGWVYVAMVICPLVLWSGGCANSTTAEAVAPEPYGAFVQISANEYGVYALDDKGNVYYHYRGSKGWYEAK